MHSLLADIAERQQASMLRRPLPADDAFALAIVTKKLSFDVAQHAQNQTLSSLVVGYRCRLAANLNVLRRPRTLVWGRRRARRVAIGVVGAPGSGLSTTVTGFGLTSTASEEYQCSLPVLTRTGTDC
jgi:hypothetical protein